MKNICSRCNGCNRTFFIANVNKKMGIQFFAIIRNTSQVEAMKKVGAIPVIADVFNRKAVFSVLEETNPDVVIHQLTSLSSWDF